MKVQQINLDTEHLKSSIAKTYDSQIIKGNGRIGGVIFSDKKGEQKSSPFK